MLPQHSARVLLAIVTVLSASASTAFADTITWNLSGNAGLLSAGQTLTFTQDGIKVKATPWSGELGTGSSTAISANPGSNARLGQWSAGLGVCNQSSSSSCGNPEHQVDNVGTNDWVLFTFSEAIDIQSIIVDPCCDGDARDTDVSYWAGNLSLTGSDGLGFNLAGYDNAELNTLFGMNRVDQSGPSQTGAVTHVISTTPSSKMVNAILFGAKVGNPDTTSAKDYFKIKTIVGIGQDITVPEPGVLAMVGLGLAAIAHRARRRRVQVRS